MQRFMPVDANVKGDVGPNGHVRGQVGANFNVEGVEVGGNVGVDKNWEVIGAASVGVCLGSLGGVDLHVTAGPDGVKTGVGAYIDAGPLYASGSVDVDQNGKVSAGATGTADLGPLGQVKGNIGIDGNGQASANASGSVGAGPASVSGSIGVDYNGQITGVSAGPLNIGGNINVGSNGQASGSLSGGVSACPLNAWGNLNIGSGGQVSGSGIANVGGMNVGGSFGTGGSGSSGSGSGGSGSSPMSGSSSGSWTSSGSGSIDSTGVNGWKPNMMNSRAVMQGLPSGGQSVTGYNPSTFFQQAGYQEFLSKMGYDRK